MFSHFDDRTLVAVGILPVAVSAGPIFIPGKLDGDTFVPEANAATPCYSIRYSAIKADISGGTAKVRLLETVIGPASPVETACIIPLPETMDGNDAVVALVNADGKDTPVAGVRFLSVTAAQAIYESVVKGIDRPQLLSLSGRPALVVPTFLLKGEMEFSVTFRQKVENRDGIQSIQLPTPVRHCASGAVGKLTAEVALSAEAPLRTIFSPSHDMTVVRDGLTKAVARTKCDQWAGNTDLRLFWVADADELGLRVLASRPEKDEDGYFMLLGNPTGSRVAAKPVPRDVIFVLDTSGSMRGEKIEQARAAMEYCLGRLNPEGRFNIITFGSKVTPFRKDSIDVSAGNVAAARTFVEDVVAEGGSEYVKPKEEIDAKVAVLYDRLANPVLADIQLAFGDLQTSAVYPKKLPALFRGSEIMVFGRYRNGSKQTITVSGQLAGKALSYSCTANLPEASTTEAGTEFIAPLWATRTIGFLLQEIRLRGRNDELIAEVVRLSRRYGIVTEYTEFIAASGKAAEKMSDKELVGAVKGPDGIGQRHPVWRLGRDSGLQRPRHANAGQCLDGCQHVCRSQGQRREGGHHPPSRRPGFLPPRWPCWRFWRPAETPRPMTSWPKASTGLPNRNLTIPMSAACAPTSGNTPCARCPTTRNCANISRPTTTGCSRRSAIAKVGAIIEPVPEPCPLGRGQGCGKK